MSANRIERVNADVTRTLANLFRDVKDPRVNCGMISVTGAEVTSDLKFCKVWLSVFRGSNSGTSSFNERDFKKGLRSCSGWLRRELARNLNLRQTPELTFYLDKSIEHGAHISEMLTKLDISYEADENEEVNETEESNESDD